MPIANARRTLTRDTDVSPGALSTNATRFTLDAQSDGTPGAYASGLNLASSLLRFKISTNCAPQHRWRETVSPDCGYFGPAWLILVYTGFDQN